MQFRKKLRPGEALEWAWFGDIRLIGMYFLGDSSHMVQHTHDGRRIFIFQLLEILGLQGLPDQAGEGSSADQKKPIQYPKW